MLHVSPPHTRTNRFRLVAAALAAGLASVGVGVVQAQVSIIGGPATADSTAERLVIANPGLLFPIDPVPMCEVFNNFGGYSKAGGSGGHQGVDIGATLGQDVYAVEAGVLYRQFDSSASGNGWGLSGDSGTKYRYYHLDGYAPGLKIGDRVAEGQVIGYVGDSGNASPGGYHLHFEVRPPPAPHLKSVDPVPLLAIPATCNVY